MSTLTDRYVYATTRYLSASRRDDIARELAASIDDMVTARVDGGEANDAAERAVLTDLGNPDLLAAQYADKPMHLIGPRLFPTYLRVTGTVLLIVPLLVAVIAALAKIADDGSVGEAVGEGVGAMFAVGIQIAFWSTLAFALIERFGGETDLPEWTVDSLPEPVTGRQVSLTDTVASVFFIGLVGAALVMQHFRSWITDDAGDDVPVLDPDLWSFWLPLLLASLAASIVVELWKYRTGRYTWPIVVATAVTSLWWLIPVVWLAVEDRLMSHEFVSTLDISAANVDRINGALIVIAIVIEVVTVGDAVLKARRANAVVRT